MIDTTIIIKMRVFNGYCYAQSIERAGVEAHNHKQQHFYLERNDKLKNTPGGSLKLKMSVSVRGELD